MAGPEKLQQQQEKIDTLFDMAKRYSSMDMSKASKELRQQVVDLRHMVCQTGRKFAEVLIRLRDFNGATRVLHNALSIIDDLETRQRLADVCQLAGQWQQARDHYQAAQKAGGANPSLHLALLFCQKQAEQAATADAASRTTTAMASSPDETLNALSFEALMSGDFQLGLALTSQAAFIDPADVIAQFNFAQALQGLGRMSEAKAAYLNVLALQPNNVDAHLLLGMLEPCLPDDPRLIAMEQLHNALANAPDQRLKIGFALYKAMHELKRYEHAFKYLQDANQARRQQFRNYTVETDIALMQQLEALFSQELINTLPQTGDPTEAPIFIVGLPRSGTSLTEQILASHNQVYGAGELETLSYRIQEYFFEPDKKTLGGHEHLTADNLLNAAQAYIAPLRAKIGPDPRIVDKMPVNFLWVGFIKLMFPKAKIIITTRDLVANGFALYSSYFPSDGMQYSYDLTETARYSVAQRRLAAHWKMLFPQDVLELNYEQLTLDQEGQTRRLLAFCDLPWDARCLEFHTSDRAVLTLSSAQVRQGLYSGIDKKTAHYRHYLQDMVSILQDAGLVPDDTTAPQ